METDGGGWTVFQRRNYGSVDFNREWIDYERGFGNLSGEYWLGLASLHHFLQLHEANKLRIDLKDFRETVRMPSTVSFSAGDSSSKYRLSVSGYSGTAGDAIAASGRSSLNVNEMKFSTKDQDNDNNGGVNCAVSFEGGWWFNHCHRNLLKGLYESEGDIAWYTWKRWSSLAFSEMKFRKKA